MIQIRKGVFETNSSSVHTITICPKDDYDKWIKGEVLFNRDDEKFYTLEEIIREIKSDKYYSGCLEDIDTTCLSEDLEEILRDWEFYTVNNYGENYEKYSEWYTTKNGDEIVAFGYVGNGY